VLDGDRLAQRPRRAGAGLAPHAEAELAE